jgi:hypothetical protein
MYDIVLLLEPSYNSSYINLMVDFIFLSMGPVGLIVAIFISYILFFQDFSTYTPLRADVK